MSNRSFFWPSVLLIIVVLGPACAVFAQPPSHSNYKEGELLVHFAPKVRGLQRTRSEQNKVLKSLNAGTVKRSYKRVQGLTVVKLPKGLGVKNALKRFKNRPEILYAEPNFRIRAFSTVPNDTLYDGLWGMENVGQTIYSPRVPAGEYGTTDADIDAPEAWDIHTGSYDIVVAVIDTGVDYLHPDLAANMWINQAEYVNGYGDPNDESGDGYPGIAGVDDDGDGLIDEDSQDNSRFLQDGVTPNPNLYK